MLLDKAELDRRIHSRRNLCSTLPSVKIVPLHNPQPPKTQHNTPQSLQIVAGILSKTEKKKDVAEAFDISVGAVRKAERSEDPVVRSAIEHTTERIRDMALNKLLASLGIINDESLSNCGARDASVVARNLAGVVEKLSPKDTAASQVTLVVYAPQQRDEKHYDTLEIKALS